MSEQHGTFRLGRPARRSGTINTLCESLTDFKTGGGMRSIAVGLISLLFTVTAGNAQVANTFPLYSVAVGSGSPTIMVLHGGPGIRHDYLRPEWDALAALGTVVYYDQRGCGRSTPLGPHGWQQHVQDLKDLVSRVSPDEPVVVAGSSFGSILALLFAYRHPEDVSALILSGLSQWPDPEQFQIIFDRQPAEVQALYRALESMPTASDLVLDSASVANSGGFHPVLAPRIGPSCTGTGRTLSISMRDGIPAEALQRISARALIATGPLMRPSDLAGAETIAQLLPNGEVIWIDETGHNPWVEQAEEFFSVVKEFLRTPATP